MKLTVGNVIQLMVLGCILFWIAAGIIGYYAFVDISE